MDDTKSNIDILVKVLGNSYRLAVALDGKTALDYANNYIPDLILLDIMMPELDGYEVIKRLKANPRTKDIPVIFVSALSEIKCKSDGFRLGAVDYIIKPFEIEEIKARIKTHLLLTLTQRELALQNEMLEKKVKERTRELISTQQATIMSMATLAEYRDSETGGHINRVKGFVEKLAKSMKNHSRFKAVITEEYIELLTLSCPLHDIGKVGVPDHILLKPGKLTYSEFEEMKLHTVYGRNVIVAAEKNLGDMSFLRIAKEIIYTHHEKWDGTGYPKGLKGEDIPISGRIMAIADVYDALISRRVYKPPLSHREAINIIRDGKGKHFDPYIVEIFLENHGEFRKIAMEYAEFEEERQALRII